ncbi:MAG: hypothetical protein ACRBFS_02710 [Aureispira sp.]
MPPIVGLLALCVLGLLLYLFATSQNKHSQAVLDERAQQEMLASQVEQLQKTVKQLEQRLKNVETIVTDTKFVDPPTSGREAINLQAEIADLKKIIQNLR